MAEIAEGVQEFHNMGFCLRTLRPSTVFVISDAGDNFKIAFSELRNCGNLLEE
jgi:hypothetical protein